MSSPILQDKNRDSVLMYAPPWARDEARRTAAEPRQRAEPPHPDRSLDDGPAFSGDRAVLEMQRQLSLDPTTVPLPPSGSTNQGVRHLVMRACSLAAIAAVAAGAIVLVFGARPPLDETAEISTAAAPTLIAPAKRDTLRAGAPMQVERPSAKADHDERAPVDASADAVPNRPNTGIAQHDTAAASPLPNLAFGKEERRADMAEQAGRAVDDRAPLTSRPAASAASPTSGLILRRLDRDEVASLVKRGEDFISSGDIAAARLVLQRAAEAGDAHAALVLASTFDPNLLERLGMPELADAKMARLWYARAEQFGSAEAPRRLQQLANRASPSP